MIYMPSDQCTRRFEDLMIEHFYDYNVSSGTRDRFNLITCGSARTHWASLERMIVGCVRIWWNVSWRPWEIMFLDRYSTLFCMRSSCASRRRWNGIWLLRWCAAWSPSLRGWIHHLCQNPSLVLELPKWSVMLRPRCSLISAHHRVIGRMRIQGTTK